MQQLQTTESMAAFAVSKANREELAIQIVEAIDAGELNPLQIHYQVKAMEDFIKVLTANTRYKDAILTEGMKHGKSFEFNGSKMEIKETGVKYDYSKCGDPEWDQYESKINSLKESQKDREKFLKSMPVDGIEIVNHDSGEVLRIYPPVKTSTTSIAVTLK
jgi:hypothetical protein